MAGGRVRNRSARGPKVGRAEHFTDTSTAEFRGTLLSAMEDFLAACTAVETPEARFCGLLEEMQAARVVCQAESIDANDFPRIGACLSDMSNANFISRYNLQASAVRLADVLSHSWFIDQPGDVLRFFARVALTCENPCGNVAELSTLRVALRAVHTLLTDRHLANTSLIIDAVQTSAASLSEAIRCALFTGAERGAAVRSSGESSDGASTRRGIYSESASDVDQSGTDEFLSSRASALTPSVTAGRRYFREGISKGSNRGWSAHAGLRLNALDALTSLASTSSKALIPYWVLFLPERDGVVGYSSSFARNTLANIILHDPRHDIRAAAVGSAIALLSGSSHFTRSQVSVMRLDLPSSPPSFTSTSARVVRVCSVMYGVVAAAIQHEQEAGVLSRLMKLATVLCHNAGASSVSPQRLVLLHNALRLRLLYRSGIDRTSRTAGLSCLAEILPMLSGVLSASDTEHLITSLILMLREEESPVAEALSAIQGTFDCKPSLVKDHWTLLEKELSHLSDEFADDQVVRLHVLRTVKCVLEKMALEPWGPRHCLEALVAIWPRYIRVSFEAPFHAVRNCGLQCAESLFVALSALKPLDLDSELLQHDLACTCVSTIGHLLQNDSSIVVRCAAVKALSETPACRRGDELGRSAYVNLVICLTADPSLGVRARAMLASASFIEGGTGWLKHDENGGDNLLLDLMQSHWKLALALLSSGGNICDLKSIEGMDEKYTDFALKKSDAAQSEWEAMRISSLRALGSFVMGFPDAAKFALDGGFPVDDIRKTALLVCQVTSRASESPKLRWNGCHLLGRFVSGGLNLQLFGDVIAVVSEVLCSAMTEGSNYKVKIAASKALRKAILSASKPRLHEPHKVLTAAASILSEGSEHGEVNRGVDMLRNDLITECNGLLAETLQILEPENCRMLGQSVGISLEILFNGLVSHSGLPRYALLALDGQNSGEAQEEEEHRTALDAWTSLPPDMRCSFQKAAEIARHSSPRCSFRDLLIRSVLLLRDVGGEQ